MRNIFLSYMYVVNKNLWLGALTSKPYAFTARSWELQSVLSFDISDGEGVGVKYQMRGNEILRVLPGLRGLNKDWISDKTRFNYDGFFKNRIYFPVLNFRYLEQLLNTMKFINASKLIEVNKRLSWEQAILLLKKIVNKKNIDKLIGLVSTQTDFYTVYLMKLLLSITGSSDSLFSFNSFDPYLCRNNKSKQTLNNLLDSRFIQKFFTNHDYNYVSNVNNTEAQLIESDFILLINVNLRLESPILFAKLRKELNKTLKKKLIKLFLLGADSTGLEKDTYINLGSSIFDFKKLVEGRHRLASRFQTSKNPFFIFGESRNNKLRDSTNELLLYCYTKKWQGLFLKNQFLNSKDFWQPFYTTVNSIGQNGLNMLSTINLKSELLKKDKELDINNSVGLIVIGDSTKEIELIKSFNFKFIIEIKTFNFESLNKIGNKGKFRLPTSTSVESRLNYINTNFEKQITEIIKTSINTNNTNLHQNDQSMYDNIKYPWHILKILLNFFLNFNNPLLLVRYINLENSSNTQKLLDTGISEYEPCLISTKSAEELLSKKFKMMRTSDVSLEPWFYYDFYKTHFLANNTTKIINSDYQFKLLNFNTLHNYYISDSTSNNSINLNLAQKIRENKDFTNFSEIY